MSDKETFPMTKIVYKNRIIEIKERNLLLVQKIMKQTDETLDQAIERLTIEAREQELADEIESMYQRIRSHSQTKHSSQRKKKKDNPHTLDYYLKVDRLNELI